MRNTTSLVAVFGLALTVGACAGSDKKKADEPVISASEQALQERQQTASQVDNAMKNVENQREDYKTQAENTLNNLEAKIAQLKASAPTQAAERQTHSAMVSGLEQRLANARASMARLENADMSEWKQRQQATEQAILTAQSAYQAAESRFMAH